MTILFHSMSQFKQNSPKSKLRIYLHTSNNPQKLQGIYLQTLQKQEYNKGMINMNIVRNLEFGVWTSLTPSIRPK